MDKQEFLSQLRKALSGLPQEDIEERIAFYSEMIEDQMEEGISEQEAVASVGSAEEIARQILSEIPFTKIAKERIKPKRPLSAPEITLLILCFPIWFSLGIAALVVVFSVYAVLWSVIISLWAVFVSLVASFVGCLGASIVFFIGGTTPAALVCLAGSCICAGISVLMFFGCKAVTAGILKLTKLIAVGIKNLFLKKEASK